MANSDYVVNGSGNFAASARLLAGVNYLDTTIYFEKFRTNGTTPVAGDTAWMGGEFMKIVAFQAGKMTVARGCIDTIPRPASAGTTIWFIRSAVGTNNVAYAAGEDVGVKTLPRSNKNSTLGIEKSPPEGLHFVGRFALPYAPGNVKANGSPWYTGGVEVTKDHPLSLSWAHRDRVVQADQLVGHGEASIGPETGASYRVRMARAEAPDVVVAEYAGIAGDTFSYDIDTAKADFEIEIGTAAATFELGTVAPDNVIRGDSGAVLLGGNVFTMNAGTQLNKLDGTDLSLVKQVFVGVRLVKLITDGTYLYLLYGGDPTAGDHGSVRKFDTDLNELASIGFNSVADAGSITYCAGSIWACMRYTTEVWRINPATMTKTAVISVTAPLALMDSDGTAVYVATIAGHTITRIDPATNSLALTFDTGVSIYNEMRVVNGRVWYLDYRSTYTTAKLLVFDGATGTPITHDLVDFGISYLTLSKCGTLLAAQADRTIHIINTTTMTLDASFEVGAVNTHPLVTLLTADRLFVFDRVRTMYYDRTTGRKVQPENVNAVLQLHAMRDGLESFEHYEVAFKVIYEEPYGLGYRLGESLGGVAP